MERYDIMSLRWHFIWNKKHVAIKGAFPIIILDEMYVNQNHVVSKSWQSDMNVVLMLLTGSRNGLTMIAWTRSISKNVLMKNSCQIFLPIVVMENVAYFCTQIVMKLNTILLKCQMQE